PGKTTERQKKDKKRYGGGSGETTDNTEGGLQKLISPPIPVRTMEETERMERGKAEKIPFLLAPPEDGKHMLPFDSSSRDNRYGKL
ncbi:4447_t:CDS:1, partial [Paraglomus brasilianum]